MTATTLRSPTRDKVRVRPSKVDPTTAKPFTLEQELKPFGTWVGEPIWVPPKDSSTEMAESMLSQPKWSAPLNERWEGVVQSHRDTFTQVREIELRKASIRLPKGRLLVSVTEQARFDTITDDVPACVQTRLDEFLAGPGKQRGVKVYYLKPLCVEVDDELHFTSHKDVMAAIDRIQQEVFGEYQRLFVRRRCQQVMRRSADCLLAVPRAVANYGVQKRKRMLDEYQAKLEFEKRKTALRAARVHCKLRSDGCSFDDIMGLTNPLVREDVVEQYALEKKLSTARQKQLLRIAAGQLPWFVALTIGVTHLVATFAVVAAPPVAVADPVFVAEMPGSNGVVLNIGHFDEVAGVKHIEL